MEHVFNRFFIFGFLLLIGLGVVTTVFPALNHPVKLVPPAAPIADAKPADLKKPKPVRKENHVARQTSTPITIDVSAHAVSTPPRRLPPGQP